MNDAPLDRTLAAAGDSAAPSPVERLLKEQRSHWERGDRAPIETFLDQCPFLRDDAEGLLCLIFNEVILREERGQAPRAEEYQRRFPHLAARIELQFAMDGALRSELLNPATVVTGAEAPSAAGDPSEPTALPSLPGYEILGELGRGGMGVVYRARQLGFNRVVAVKMILAGADAAEREGRFRIEAEAVARLQHPHIVQVYEVGVHRGRPFFSMEFCPGGGLDKKLNGTPLPPREAAALIEKLAGAVEAAHQARVVHRDLKPANVLLTVDGTPKVTDFGLAKRLDADLAQTRTGDILGTPSYMAPEQAGGRPESVGPAADVYALGAMLYECLTGRPPFKAATALETLVQVAADDPVPPRRLQPKAPRDLDTICLKCLEKAPGRRYPTARELGEELRRFLAGEPVRARPVGAPGRGWRWARKHKLLVGLAAAALAVLALGAALTWQAVAQASELSRGVRRDLREASQFEQEARWAEARAAVRRAEERLARGGPADLMGQFRQASDDLEMAAKLEEIPLLRTASVREGWDFESADRAYRDAFAGHGLDLEAMDPGEAATRIRASAIKDQLTEALDDWILNNQRSDDPFQQHLFDVVQRTDPDEWRCQVRRAAKDHDRAELGRLADNPESAEFSPVMTLLLSDALGRAGDWHKSLELLRPAQRRRPDHFWLDYKVGYSLNKIKGARQEEAIGFLRASLAVRPQSPGAHVQLGLALDFRGKFEEAEAECRKALEIQPDNASTHSKLGYVLMERGKFEEAEAECRKAIEIQPDYPYAHTNLGAVLRGRRQDAAAEAEYRKALAIQPNNSGAHNGLGNLLCALGQDDAAEAEYRKALVIQPDYVHAHNGLGNVLRDRGRDDAAEAEYRKALDIQPNYALAHRGLAGALKGQAHFADAIEAARTWQQQVTPGDAQHQAAAKEVEECARLLELDGKLPAVLAGDVQPESADERLEYAKLCGYKKLHAAAVRFYSDAFTADPNLAEYLPTNNRYNAACAAALASRGQGEGAAGAGEEDRARWRRQALDWLEADLARRGKREESDGPQSHALAERTMRLWQTDARLGGVRDADALAKLPDAERERWRKLWAGVEELLRRAEPLTP